jgi:hypothetical protein
MKMKIPPRDFKKLSAYLDGQLSPRQRNHLEARLKKETELQATLLDLRHTLTLLRTTPRQRSPRNFTVTPEMVGQPRKVNARLYPAFRLASALASLLFVVVVVGDTFGIEESLYSTGVDQAAPQIVAVQEKEIAPQMEAVEAPAVDTTEEPVMAAPAPDSFDIQAEIAAVPETELGEALSSMPAEGQAGTEEFGEVMLEAIPGDEGEAASSEITGLKEATPREEEMGVVEETPDTTGLDETVAGTNATDAQTREVDDDNSLERKPQELEPGVDRTAEKELFPESKWSLLRLVELILGIIALGTGAMAFNFRRRV